MNVNRRYSRHSWSTIFNGPKRLFGINPPRSVFLHHFIATHKLAVLGLVVNIRHSYNKATILTSVVYAPPFPADTAEYVAQKILKGIEDGEAEIFAHDWMKRGVNANS